MSFNQQKFESGINLVGQAVSKETSYSKFIQLNSSFQSPMNLNASSQPIRSMVESPQNSNSNDEPCNLDGDEADELLSDQHAPEDNPSQSNSKSEKNQEDSKSNRTGNFNELMSKIIV